MGSQYILGPINTNTSFMFVTLIDQKPYILKLSTFGGLNLYYWESRLDMITADISVFVASGTTPNNVSFHSTKPVGYMGVNANHNPVLVLTPVSFKIFEPAFATWNSPTLFLGDVAYEMHTEDGTLLQIPTDSQGGSRVPATGIFILPVAFYSICNGSTYQSITMANASLVNWLCSQKYVPSHPDYITFCSGFSTIPSGWTNLQDCMVGNEYVYCPTGTVCGTNNCNGPCQTTGTICGITSNNTDTYKCIVNTNPTNTQWWHSPYFIATVIGFSILIIIMIIILIITPKKS